MNELLVKELKDKKEFIETNVKNALIKAQRKDNVKIIAVSKTHPAEMVYNAMLAGINSFGENYVQELVEKYNYFKDNNLNQPEWHFIGLLQTNKVKYIVPFVDLIHSVDSVHLAEEINKRARANNKVQNILLQINTSGEDSKSGCEPDEAVKICKEIFNFDNLKLLGLMTIGTFTDNEIQQRKEFTILRNKLKEINNQLNLNLKELSMGMTNDYPIAIEEGATIVRIGTAFFGYRKYN
jgi:pyridoxal phosphate enzyme (YggS family)